MKEAANRVLKAMEKATSDMEARRKKDEQSRWIATNGADLSGHDFGCEWIWVMWRGFCPSLEYPSAPGVEPQWSAISHYMLTDIKTPSVPCET